LKGNAYLVFSSRSGQCRLTSDRLEIYKTFPGFFVKNEDQAKIDNLIKSREEGKELKSLLDKLKISPDVMIEFRFETMKYSLIETLKRHPRVKHPHDMMSRRWIRVIFSPIKEIKI